MRAGHFLGLLLLGAGIAVVQPKNAPTIKGKIYFIFLCKGFSFCPNYRINQQFFMMQKLEKVTSIQNMQFIKMISKSLEYILFYCKFVIKSRLDIIQKRV